MGGSPKSLLEHSPDKYYTRIGQKLSERVESFHFTHNINRFRRQMNLELQSDPVKPWLRQDLGSVMVLPVGLADNYNRIGSSVNHSEDQLALQDEFGRRWSGP